MPDFYHSAFPTVNICFSVMYMKSQILVVYHSLITFKTQLTDSIILHLNTSQLDVHTALEVLLLGLHVFLVGTGHTLVCHKQKNKFGLKLNKKCNRFFLFDELCGVFTKKKFEVFILDSFFLNPSILLYELTSYQFTTVGIRNYWDFLGYFPYIWLPELNFL